MSNAAKFETPDGADDGKTYVYSSGSDSHVLTSLAALYQPLDSDLTAVAALTTTSFGRGLLELANAAALRTTAGLVIGTDVQAYSAVLAATTASFTTADETKLDGIEAGATADMSAAEILAALLTVDGAGSGLDADLLDGNSSAAFATAGHNHDATYQPLDSDLTAIAALTTTVFGRALLALADAAALRTAADVGAEAVGGDLTGTVGNAQIAAGAVGATELATDAVTNAKVADDAIGIAELSATGTPSSSTFLRGDNTWASPAGGGGGDLLAANNLSDVANVATARTNLGLAIGTDVQGYSAVLAATTASFTTADETKLDGIEAAADVTDETNVVAALSGATLTDVGTPASGDKILLLDASDSDNLKTAAFSTFGGGGATVDHPSIFASGEYQTPWGFGSWVVGGRTIGSTLENSNNLLMAYLHRTVAGATFDAMAINVQTAADATSNVLLAAYAADGIDGYPGTLIAEAGAVSITTTGTKVVTFSSPITPGAWFWAVMFTDVSGTVVPKLGGPASMYEYGWLPHDIESDTGNGPSHLFLSYTYPGAGSAPATFPAGATQRNVANATGGAFYVAMRKA